MNGGYLAVASALPVVSESARGMHVYFRGRKLIGGGRYVRPGRRTCCLCLDTDNGEDALTASFQSFFLPSPSIKHFLHPPADSLTRHTATHTLINPHAAMKYALFALALAGAVSAQVRAL